MMAFVCRCGEKGVLAGGRVQRFDMVGCASLMSCCQIISEVEVTRLKLYFDFSALSQVHELSTTQNCFCWYLIVTTPRIRSWVYSADSLEHFVGHKATHKLVLLGTQYVAGVFKAPISIV